MPQCQRNSSGQYIVRERGERKTACYSSIFLPFLPWATWLYIRNWNCFKKNLQQLDGSPLCNEHILFICIAILQLIKKLIYQLFLITLLTNVLLSWLQEPCLDIQHDIRSVAIGKTLYVAYLPLPSRWRQNLRENSALIQWLSLFLLL